MSQKSEIRAEVVFERKFYSKMLDWKAHLADKCALLVEGARRVGKTHLVTRFAKNEYETFVYIDFSLKNKVTKESRRAFEEESSIEDTIERLAVIQGVRLIPGRTCFVFDEVQRYPPAREAIKALMAYGKYHYIETGSLLGIKENVKDIVIPSEEHSMKLFPLDFEEFLDVLGEDVLSNLQELCGVIVVEVKLIGESVLKTWVHRHQTVHFCFVTGKDDEHVRVFLAERGEQTLYGTTSKVIAALAAVKSVGLIILPLEL